MASTMPTKNICEKREIYIVIVFGTQMWVACNCKKTEQIRRKIINKGEYACLLSERSQSATVLERKRNRNMGRTRWRGMFEIQIWNKRAFAIRFMSSAKIMKYTTLSSVFEMQIFCSALVECRFLRLYRNYQMRIHLIGAFSALLLVLGASSPSYFLWYDHTGIISLCTFLIKSHR